MDTPDNPYVSSAIASLENSHRSKRNNLLLSTWFLSIIAIPGALIYEEYINYRIDISRPEYCRGQLDRRGDLWLVFSSAFQNIVVW